MFSTFLERGERGGERESYFNRRSHPQTQKDQKKKSKSPLNRFAFPVLYTHWLRIILSITFKSCEKGGSEGKSIFIG